MAIPKKKTSKVEEESKKIKTSGKIAKPKTLKKVVEKKDTTPKKKGAKPPTDIKVIETSSISKKTVKTTPKAIEKKVTKTKTVKKASTPKKLDPTIRITTQEVTTPVPIMERIGPSKTKRFKEDRYVKISTNASKEDFYDVGRRVQDGTLQWAFFAKTSEDESYHYYLDLTKKI